MSVFSGGEIRGIQQHGTTKDGCVITAGKKIIIKKWPAREILLAVILAAVMILVGMFAFQLRSGGVNRIAGIQTDQKDDQIGLLVQELLSPMETAVGDGKGKCYLMSAEDVVTAGSFRKKSPEYVITSVMKDFFSKEIRSKKVSKKQYSKEASGRSMILEYSCSLPFELFLQNYELENPQGDPVSSVSSVIMIAENGGTLYLYDGEQNSWYRLAGKETDAVITDQFLKELTVSAKKNDGTRETTMISGKAWSGAGNLLPTEKKSDSRDKAGNKPGSYAPAVSAESLLFTPEYNPMETKAVRKLEQIFFPQGLDFIQNVARSDGARTYMYGSMETMLQIDSGGSLSFRQDLRESKGTPDLYGCLRNAVRYIRKHGGWPAQQDGVSVRLVKIRSMKADSGKKTEGYQFTFELDVQGMPLVYESGKQMSIVIGENGVFEYYRDLPDLTVSGGTQNDRTSAESASKDSGQKKQNTTSADSSFAGTGGKSAFVPVWEAKRMSLQEVIKADSDQLKTALAHKGTKTSKMSTEELQEEILNEISSAELQLLRTENAGQTFTAEGLTGSSGKNISSGRSGSRSTVNNKDQKDKENAAAFKRGLVPVWRICIGKKVFLISAQNGRLLQDL